MKKKAKKNPRDLTTRNARASKKRDDKLALKVHDHEERLKKLEKALELVMG